MRESAREGISLSIIILIVGMALLLLVAAWTVAHYATLGPRMNVETQAQRQSVQYVETKANLLLKLQTDYERPDATDEQKAAIVTRMKAERALIPADQVPPSVNAFLRGK